MEELTRTSNIESMHMFKSHVTRLMVVIWTLSVFDEDEETIWKGRKSRTYGEKKNIFFLIKLVEKSYALKYITLHFLP